MAYCTLEEVKAHLGHMTAETDDDILEDIINAVSAEIDKYCDRTFTSSSATKYYDGVQDDLLVDDLVSVTSLKLDMDGDHVYETTLSDSDYDLLPYNESPKWLVKLSESSSYGSFAEGKTKAVEITGMWGFSSVPEPVKQAAIIQSCRIYRLSQSGYGTEIGTPEIGVSTVYQGLSSDARRLLAPFIKVTYA